LNEQYAASSTTFWYTQTKRWAAAEPNHLLAFVAYSDVVDPSADVTIDWITTWAVDRLATIQWP